MPENKTDPQNISAGSPSPDWDYATHTDQITRRYNFAMDIARQAGELVRQGYGHVSAVSHKGAIDLVTEYDLKSEQLILENIRRLFPDDGILAEESGKAAIGEYQWFIDPLDGTTNFVHGLPVFSISIACAYHDQILVGIVYDPLRDELFHTHLGAGAFLNQQPLHVSASTDLSQSFFATGFPYDIRTGVETNLEKFAYMCMHTQAVRQLGSAALDLAYVAAGRYEGYWEMKLWPWDWAAGMLLVHEAGGVVSRISGEDNIFDPPTSMLATNGHIHQQTIIALQQA